MNLTDDDRLLMIYGRAQLQDSSTVLDYVACFYPEGDVNEDYNYLFDHDTIEKVYHMGYQTPQDEEFQEIICESLNQYFVGRDMD